MSTPMTSGAVVLDDPGRASAQMPHYVYRWLAADGCVFYIGMTQSLVNRIAAHRASSLFAARCVTVDWELWPTREAADARETELIGAQWPLANENTKGHDIGAVFSQRRAAGERAARAARTGDGSERFRLPDSAVEQRHSSINIIRRSDPWRRSRVRVSDAERDHFSATGWVPPRHVDGYFDECDEDDAQRRFIEASNDSWQRLLSEFPRAGRRARYMRDHQPPDSNLKSNSATAIMQARLTRGYDGEDF